ncbi:MAG: response regulator, partial [Proteobacteria bacterium]|nr:response regulator [Pseudomonadota bacterium]
MPEKNILIADDDESIQRLFVEILKDEGYRIFQASNGKEAVEIAGKNPIDLAVLDIVMPVMDGVAALKRIREIDKTIEILMITGYADLGSLKESLFDYGAFDYLLKPFHIVELRFAIRRALRNRELGLKSSLVKEELENRILELERDFKEKTFRLRESQIKYRSIVENSTDAIVVAQDECLKFANRKTTELSGYSQEEILNSPFTEMIFPDDREMVLNMFRTRLRDGDAAPVYTFRVLRKDGSF